MRSNRSDVYPPELVMVLGMELDDWHQFDDKVRNPSASPKPLRARTRQVGAIIVNPAGDQMQTIRLLPGERPGKLPGKPAALALAGVTVVPHDSGAY
jgi:hypothetical protein